MPRRIREDQIVRLQSAMREMADLHRAALDTFDKFRRCIDYVQTMTSLRELPDILEGVRQRLGMDGAHVLLDAATFAEFVPQTVPTLERAMLREAVAALPGGGALPYIGPCAAAPCLRLFLPGGPTPQGSCFIQPLPDKYRPGKRIGVIALHDHDPGRFSQDKATDFLEHFCDLLGHAVVTVRDHDQLVRDAVIDELTGAHNRLYLLRHAPRLMALAERKQMPLSLLFVDLDRFKPVNDQLGHDAGDCVLREVAQRMREAVRGYDIFVRLGGDEFVVLMPDAGQEEADALAQRLREEVAGVDIARCTGCETALRLSASVGLAGFTPGQSLEDLLRAADQGMYREKRGPCAPDQSAESEESVT